MDAAECDADGCGEEGGAPSAESADPNFVLLAALADCIAFWILVALTVYWLI